MACTMLGFQISSSSDGNSRLTLFCFALPPRHYALPTISTPRLFVAASVALNSDGEAATYLAPWPPLQKNSPFSAVVKRRTYHTPSRSPSSSLLSSNAFNRDDNDSELPEFAEMRPYKLSVSDNVSIFFNFSRLYP
jgi:hypothetical protein